VIDDIRYALRMMGKNPSFSLLVVLTLAIGIGANTSLFSIVNGVLLNRLPFPEPDQLVGLHENHPPFDSGSISYPNFRDWQKYNHTFAAMGVYRASGFALTGVGDAEQLNAQLVTSDLFPILGMKPLEGRMFANGEDEIGAAPTAMISESLWKRKFSGSPDVIGKVISLDGFGYTVIGIVPTRFLALLRTFSNVDVIVPLGQWKNSLLTDRGAGLGIHGIARLKPGVTIEQARADMEQVTRNLERTYPDKNKGIGATIRPLKQEMVGKVRPLLLLLLGAVGFVLLIACVNVANLLLARSTSRAREFAIRSALGATQGRMLRQLLTESVLLSVMGGGVGLLLASWGTKAAFGVLPAALPRAAEVQLDGKVLLFTTVVSLVAGILFGLVPALRASVPNVHEMLKEGGRGGSGARYRVQGVFVVAEMAMAVVLLIGAGLMIRTLTKLWSTDPGFRADGVLTFGMSLSPEMARAPADAVRTNYRALMGEIESMPGLRSGSLSWAAVPFAQDDEQRFWMQNEEKPASQNGMKWAVKYVVDPPYLKVMETPLLAGRFFTAQDDEHAPMVAVVDNVLAKRYFGNVSPVGQLLNLEGYPKPVEIVGVVKHVNQWGFDKDDQMLREQLYLSFMQMPDQWMKQAALGTTVMVRTDSNTPGAFESVHRAVTKISSGNTVYSPQTMNEAISESLANRRFSMILFEIFAGIALLLASIGLYGVIAYVVGQRTHEFGVRMALGARASDILGLVLKGGGKLALMGVGMGLLGAAALSRFMSHMLSGVAGTDPLTYAAVAGVLLTVAVLACWVPARRAMKVDPMVALRYE
jgi:predicted permease